MNLCERIDRRKLFELCFNVVGIYALFGMSGILRERVYKNQYLNQRTQQNEICPYFLSMLFFPFLTSYILGSIHVYFFVENKANIPIQKTLPVGTLMNISTIFSYLSVQKTSFPVAMLFETCAVVPVVLVGVFCSRVKDQKVKLGRKKLIVTAITTIGVIIFKFFDPETWERGGKQQFLGFLFILVTFTCQGFVPDLQAAIKTDYKPQATEMMKGINGGAAFVTFFLILITNQAYGLAIYMRDHPVFVWDLIGLSLCLGFGQFFIYRMIKEFKQHFVPFTVVTRKIFTIAASIIFFHHKKSSIQFIGLFIVLGAVVYEFLSEILKDKNEPKAIDLGDDNEQKKLAESYRKISVRADDDMDETIQSQQKIGNEKIII